ncbi:MAG: hypothetical protein GKR91_03935 [Pseudomonadales bacterium]|nr:hypothetical protein [Pseudomonadales bacterium]
MHIGLGTQFLCCFGLLALLGTSHGQQIDLSNQSWSAEVIRSDGQAIIPLFDGWYPNDDGSKTICFGHFNMNTEQSFDIPVGADNYLETDYPGLDLSNANVPTHFDPLPLAYRHVFCGFTVTVPAGFNTNHRITWHISSNRFDLNTPGKVIPPYVMDEPASDGRGDLAPLVKLAANGSGIRGRTGIHAGNEISANVGETVQLQAWIEHPDEEVWVGWAHHSGPGKVEFDNKEYEIQTSDGVATVQASFNEPGEYVVRMQTIDSIAAFEFYCCHTNAYFHINVSN